MDSAPDPPSSALSGPELVHQVARLARLSVDEQQSQALAASFDRILNHFARLADVNVENVENTSAEELAGEPRADIPEPSLPVEVALRNAPKRTGDFYVVPKTIVREP